MTDPIETRDPEAIRAHKAKGGKVEFRSEFFGDWSACHCFDASDPNGRGGSDYLHRLLPLVADAPPDLPPGVNRCTAADGTEYLVARSSDIPDGWEYERWGEDWVTGKPSNAFDVWVVRPPEPQPRTEPVPLTEVHGRQLEGWAEPIASVEAACTDGTWGAVWWPEGQKGRITPRALFVRDDGTVKVLVEGDQ